MDWCLKIELFFLFAASSREMQDAMKNEHIQKLMFKIRIIDSHIQCKNFRLCFLVRKNLLNQL
ncbi:hypothetical protein Leryth_025724 [Lithospermum erythrorhizon]|nr:hypothetical protein Leryth_025724 [Lithospermum erythrorhizon]